MKNFAKFLLFVLLISAGISLLYDYRLKHGELRLSSKRAAENYTLASEPSVDSKQIASLEALNRERRALVKSILPSVVAVKTSKKIGTRREYGLDPFEFFFGSRQRRFRNPRDEALVQNSLGSGVIVTNEGHIITNNHVVDQVDEIEVQLSDGQTKKARVVGADEQVDLAVLKIDNPGVKPLKLADSDTVQPGDFVLAIGNPFGFEETVTEGIISSKGRPNRSDFFGELLDVLAGSPAAQAGVQPGDVIRKFDGREVKNFTALRTLVAQTQLNKQVELEILRDGKPVKVKAQIKEQPIDNQTLGAVPRQNQPQPQTPRQPNDQETVDSPLASIHVDELTSEKARQLDLPPNARGVLVTNVDPDSGVAELQKGDVIEEINQQPVTSVSDYNKVAGSLDASQPQILSVCRHRARSFLVLRPR
ncbi:MAG: hypothetical protein DMC60_02310 [Verrucomicrobia bacterium]|nr:MAG: hypothetical protein DMC60_02310 [Verrucomicrobiota bacterium]